jgi:hypothetical protein
MAPMNDLKGPLGCFAGYSRGKKELIEEGRMFSAEELHAAFAQLMAATDGEIREVIETAMNALMARRAH